MIIDVIPANTRYPLADDTFFGRIQRAIDPREALDDIRAGDIVAAAATAAGGGVDVYRATLRNGRDGPTGFDNKIMSSAPVVWVSRRQQKSDGNVYKILHVL